MISRTGIVVHGSKRAALLGFPTINLSIETTDDLAGIYAARVTVDGGMYTAAAFADPSRHVLEAHLIDVVGDFYGKEAHIDLYKKIREHRRFETDDELKKAITSDVMDVRAYFGNI